MNQSRILVIDGEAQSRRLLKAILEPRGYTITSVEQEHGALAYLHSWHPDLIILDLELPTSVEGLGLIERMRESSQVPIIALATHNREENTVAALTSGADDLVVKPFATAELLARIQVALRHAAQRASGRQEVLSIGALLIDLVAHQVTRNSQLVHLTPTEYSILRVLALQHGQVVPHTLLLRAVWGERALQRAAKLHVFINQLRHKLEEDPAQPRYILTETGVGYRLGQ